MTGPPRRVVWSFPLPRRALGIAEKTALYPAFFLAGKGRDIIASHEPDTRLLRDCTRQVLVVFEPSKRYHEFLAAAAAAECPTTILLWCDEAVAGAAKLIHDADPRLVSVADPWRIEPGFLGHCEALPAPLLPARRYEDAEVGHRFPNLPRSEPPGWGGNSISAGPVAAIFASGDDLEFMAPTMRQASARYGIEFAVIIPGPAETRDRLAKFEGCSLVIGAANPASLEVLARSRAALIGAGAGPNGAGSLFAALWTVTALRVGVPAVTSSNPLLDDFVGAVIFDDWDRGLALYAGSQTTFRTIDRACAQARAWVAGSPISLKSRWETLISWTSASPRRGSDLASRPAVVVLFDLAQDLDILLPVMQALRAADELEPRAVVTDWLRDESPRTLTALEHEGFAYDLISRQLALAGKMTWPAGAAALLTASETTAGAHRAGHAVTRAANAAGLGTFTVQHGFENIGLTYADERYGPEVSFASQHIFIWGWTSALPAWVSLETRRRIISVGLTKRAEDRADVALPATRDWARKVGIFENLHWERFSAAYRTRFRDDFAATVHAFPDVLFVVKPHHAGRWLIDHRDFLPVAANVLLIDPRDPEWQRHTAPALLPVLDGAITTPSTVALDAAKAGRPVAVIANDLLLPMYQPLPLLRRCDDWRRFVAALAHPERGLRANESFLRRNFPAGAGERRIARIVQRLAGRRVQSNPTCGPEAAFN